MADPTPAEMHAFNQSIIDQFRANGGKVGPPFEGAPMVLLTTTGAKSGERRTTPLVHGTDGDSIYVIASKGGAPTNPAWLHNVLANPTVTVEVGDDTYEATAQVITEEPERSRLFDQVSAVMPGFKEYEEKTDRVIPVVLLNR